MPKDKKKIANNKVKNEQNFLSMILRSTNAQPSGPLAKVESYYLNHNHTTTWKEELSLQIFILSICISGAYLYFDPAEAYAERIGQSDQAWFYIFCTCFPALAVLYVATDVFLKMQAFSVPKELQDVLINPKTRKERFLENSFITAVSALSSIVLTSILFRFPPENWPLLSIAAMGFVIFVDNTVLHFLPVKLMLTQKIWRAPFLPLEYLVKWMYSKYKDHGLTQETIDERILQAVKNNAYRQLKGVIIERLQRAQEQLLLDAFQWNWKKLEWNIKLEGGPLRKLFYAPRNASLLNILEGVQDRGYYCQIPSSVKGITALFFAFIGAIWIWSSAAGYYAAPFNQFKTWTGDDFLAGLITATPIYTLSVLLGFFGVIFVGKAFEYLTTWGKNVAKIPFHIKFAPKTSFLLMLVNLTIASFAYPAAVELIYSQVTYDWAQPFIPFLAGCSYSGISYVSFMAVLDFMFSMYQKVAQHVCRGNLHALMVSYQKLEQFTNSVMYMDGSKLVQELKSMSSPTRKKILGMEDAQFKGVIDHQTNFQTAKEKAGQPDIWMRLFCCTKAKAGERKPLLEEANTSTIAPV